MKARIGENPLDALIPTAKPGGAPAPKRPVKVRMTAHVPSDLLERARDAVVALSGPPLRLTLASLVEDAMERELERLQKERNKGKPFPPRGGELRGGRPIRA